MLLLNIGRLFETLFGGALWGLPPPYKAEQAVAL